MKRYLRYLTAALIMTSGIVFAQSPGGVSGSIQLWLKANQGVLDTGGGSASDGEAVGTWQDQTTARTNDAVDDRLASPDYRNNSADNINNNPVVEFNGTNDGLDFGTDYIYSIGTGMHWFAVLRPNAEIDKTQQRIIDFGLYADNGYGFSYGCDFYGFFTSTGNGGAVTTDAYHGRSTETTLVEYQIDFGDNQYMAFNGSSSPVATQTITLASLTAANINESGTHQLYSGPVTVGQQSKTQSIDNNNGRYYSGAMAELIGYSTVLTADNKNRVETYLALKYGLTLEHNYIANISGTNTTVYDISTYPYDIAGVGQDVTDQTLTQLQSKSLNSGSLIEGTIADANIDDEEYVIWGHDNASASLGTTYNSITETRITRIWKVTATGTPGSMTISVPTSIAGGLTALVVANSPTINGPSDIVGSYALTVNGSRYEASVTFSGTQYFTFITTVSGGIKYPGGIGTNLQMWLKANAGVLNGGSTASDGQAVNTWEDQAGSNDATDANLASPTYRNNTQDNLNENPVVEFDGTEDGLDLGANFIFAPSDGLTWFAVVKPNDESGKTRQPVVDFGQFTEAGYGFLYGSEAYGFYTSVSAGGDSVVDQSHAQDTIPALVTFEVDFGNDQEMSLNGGSGLSNQSISLTGLPDANINQASTHGATSGPVTIGQQSQTDDLSSNGGRYFSGKIAEIVGYDAVLSTEDKQRIQTYMGLKYGLTLGHNYTADVAGITTIYSISGYANNIAGVGKDISNQNLSQLKSKSINDGALITGSITNGNLDDDEYVIWGHNGGSASLNTTFEGEANTRIGRIWKVVETGSAGSMIIAVDTSLADGLTFLVVSNSSTLSSTSDLTGSYELTINGANYEATVNFASNSTQYFTFISSAPGGTTFPGVVSENLEIWFKADEGALNGASPASDGQEVNTWKDVSGNLIVRNATDTNLDAPDFRDNTTDNINGNPVIEFNGSSDGLDLGGNYVFAAGSKTGLSFFSALEPNAETGRTRQCIVDFGQYTAHGYGYFYGSESYGFFTGTTEEGGQGTGASTTDQAHSNGTNPALVSFQVTFGSSGNQAIAFNGTTQGTPQSFSLLSLTSTNIDESATHVAAAGPVTIGHQSQTNGLSATNGRYSGKIAEIVGYSAVLTTNDKYKVETYLALKYGLTLSHDYVADISGSNVTIFTVNGYANDIAGIGQDNLGQGFNQHISISENDGALVAMSVNSINIDDEEYVVWGHDGGEDTLNTTFAGEDSVRLGRIWKVTESGSVGNVTISIPVSVAPSLTYLLIANTPTISEVTDVSMPVPLTINGGYYQAVVNLPNSSTRYFTFTSSTDASLPVTLTSFTAKSKNGAVQLNWVTESQVNNAGFEIWRADAKSEVFVMIADFKNYPDLAGSGNSSSSREYSFTDHGVAPGKTYSYKLADIDYTGARIFHQIVEVEVTDNRPKEYTLYANYPNPFNPATVIHFYVPEQYAGKQVSVRIYNILGQLVFTLVNGALESGEYRMTWNSQNNSDVKLPSGMYFLEMKAENFRTVRKMMMLK